MKRLICIFIILCFVSGSIGRRGFGPGEQEWGYVEVRPNAHMFWWLYYTTADVKSYYDKPLIIWLQGGPGGSSTAYGNFMELGPLDVDLNPRNYTWVKNYNVLFIDNPVGTGFSYVTNENAFVRNNAQIARDLVECMRGFYDKLPKFKPVPTYITTESYGGKMGAEFAFFWYHDQRNGNIESNLQGVALGDAWISPIDSVKTWGLFLLNMGIIDMRDFQQIDEMAKMTEKKVEDGRWKEAIQYCTITERIIKKVTYNIDFYNILEKKQFLVNQLTPENKTFMTKVFTDEAFGDTYTFLVERHGRLYSHYSLDEIMNKLVKEALGLKVSHGHQSNSVMYHLIEDFMKSVTHTVQLLLKKTDLKIYVYNGLLDLIVDAPGTYFWVKKLKWKGADTWKYSARKPLVVKGVVEGYVKATDNFAMYWVYRAGHMVPMDNPAAMERILKDLVKPRIRTKTEL